MTDNSPKGSSSKDSAPMSEPLKIETLDEGAFWLVRLARPKANIIDGDMTRALTGVFERAAEAPNLKAIILSAEGPHFSFGASVAEHAPDAVAEMLATFHGMFRTIAKAAVPTIAAVKGQCLGGGLELTAFCHRFVAAPNAHMGQPEIALGVFAPVASILLPSRVGRGAAEDLCLSGRSIAAEEAFRIGLVDEIADDPEEAALSYARTQYGPRSASSLRMATRAIRSAWELRFFEDLDKVERLYLDELMKTHDAVEGIEGFLAKRKPEWKNR